MKFPPAPVAPTPEPDPSATLVTHLVRALAVALGRPEGELSALASEPLAAVVREHLAGVHERLVRAERLATAGRLAATVAHELRNPLSVIETSAFVLAEHARSDERVSRHTQRISEQVGLANAVIGDLLESTRDRPLVFASVDIAALARTVAAELRVPATARLQVDVAADLPAVSGEARRLRQVFTNLMLNALEAAGARGTVTVGAHVADAALLVYVEDDGPGISPADAAQLFEPLFTTKRHGTGLGLAVSRELVRRHGGELRARPGAAGGARFEFTLPLAAPSGVAAVGTLGP